jgi:hypothetical protein
MGWIPVITFVHVAVDAMNAMRTVPGEFKSFGHDYRADTARFARAALGLPAVTDEQMQAVERVLRAGTRPRPADQPAGRRRHPDRPRQLAAFPSPAPQGEQLFAPAAAAPGGPSPTPITSP